MLDNQIGITYMKGWIIASAILFLITLSILSFVRNPWLLLLIMLVICIAGPFNVWWTDNIHSPRSICLEKNGFTAYFRFRKERFIKWEQLTDITYFPPDKRNRGVARVGGGHFMIIGNSFPFILKPDVAMKMRQSYFDNMGNYPPSSVARRKPNEPKNSG